MNRNAAQKLVGILNGMRHKMVKQHIADALKEQMVNYLIFTRGLVHMSSEEQRDQHMLFVDIAIVLKIFR